MTLRDELLPVLNEARTLVADLGMRQVRVIVRTTTWSGGAPQTGVATNSDREIVPRPRVNGLAGDPTLQVVVTPAHSGPPSGGYTPAQLNVGSATGIEYVYVVIGPDAVERPYKLLKMTTPRPFRYLLELESLDRRKPY